MSKKLKFKPVISRVKLNPEQAVLACSGYTTGWQENSGGSTNAYGCVRLPSPKGVGAWGKAWAFAAAS